MDAQLASTVDAASWQEAAYRCPRPGFFAGDDASVFPASPFAPASAPAAARRSTPLGNDAVLLAAGALPPAWDLGRLGVLPLELLHEIAGHVAETDVAALVALRNCNRAAAAVVDSLRDFATVAAFPRALGALVRLAPPAAWAPQAATTVSLRAMAACLRSTACASCLRRRQRRRRQGRALKESVDSSPSVDDDDDDDDDEDDVPFGDYIYLLAPERVCYACFRARPEYLPVALDVAQGAAAADRLRGLTSLRVPPGRYGVLTRLTQTVALFDRRQVYGEAAEAAEAAAAAAAVAAEEDGNRRPVGKPAAAAPGPARPEALRYAAVIPGPYWEAEGKEKTLDRGYACRACAQTDGRGAGWADPLACYTRAGLQRHLADAALGGSVQRCGGVFRHAGPRRRRFPTPAEYGATADLARRCEVVVL